MKIDYQQLGPVLTPEEHKRVQLGILKYVANYCERHNLRYFLADGTLIGAVRHNGFIPWNDDFDVGMETASFGYVERENEERYRYKK